MNDDIITYCDIYECNDCPRYGDDCDGKDEEWEQKKSISQER